MFMGLSAQLVKGACEFCGEMTPDSSYTAPPLLVALVVTNIPPLLFAPLFLAPVLMVLRTSLATSFFNLVRGDLVILTERGEVLLDWDNAASYAPLPERHLSWLIMHEVVSAEPL